MAISKTFLFGVLLVSSGAFAQSASMSPKLQQSASGQDVRRAHFVLQADSANSIHQVALKKKKATKSKKKTTKKAKPSA